MKFNTETKVTENTSSFEWTIKLPRAGNFQSPYLITSEEISLPSRDLTWSVSLTETLCHDGIRHFEAKFLLDKDFVDQSNSMCFIGITFNGKTSEMPSTEKNLKNGGYYINSAIEVPSDQESIILTPFCIYKELVSETKQVDEAEDFIDEEVLNQTEFDYLEDSLRMMNKSPEQRLNKTFRGEESFRDALDMTAGQVEEEAASIQQEEVWKALEIKTPSKTAVEKVEEVEEETRKHLFPSDEHALLAERIENIYLKKMRQVAETSSSLMVLASRTNIGGLFSECCKSLAAQTEPNNFSEIWNIGCELNSEELKQSVVDYVVKNIDYITYGPIPADLMLEVVRATK